MGFPLLRRYRPLNSLLYVLFIALYTYTYIFKYSAVVNGHQAPFCKKNNIMHNGLRVVFSAKTARFDVGTSRTHRPYLRLIVCAFSAREIGAIKHFSHFFIHKNTPIITATTIIIMLTRTYVRNSRKYNGKLSFTIYRRYS